MLNNVGNYAVLGEVESAQQIRKALQMRGTLKMASGDLWHLNKPASVAPVAEVNVAPAKPQLDGAIYSPLLHLQEFHEAEARQIDELPSITTPVHKDDFIESVNGGTASPSIPTTSPISFQEANKIYQQYIDSSDLGGEPTTQPISPEEASKIVPITVPR